MKNFLYIKIFKVNKKSKFVLKKCFSCIQTSEEIIELKVDHDLAHNSISFSFFSFLTSYFQLLNSLVGRVRPISLLLIRYLQCYLKALFFNNQFLYLNLYFRMNLFFIRLLYLYFQMVYFYRN